MNERREVEACATPPNAGPDGRPPFVYRDDWWQKTRCPYCGADRNEDCRSKATGNSVSPHMARLHRAIQQRKET